MPIQRLFFFASAEAFFEFLSDIHWETLRDIWSNAILKTTYISWCSDAPILWIGSWRLCGSCTAADEVCKMANGFINRVKPKEGIFEKLSCGFCIILGQG